MKRYFFFFLIFIPFILIAQTKERKKGFITFISSQFVYLKFNGTEGLNKEDTLFIEGLNLDEVIPAAVIQFISSNSIAAKPLLNLKLGDTLFAFLEITEREKSQKVNTNKTESVFEKSQEEIVIEKKRRQKEFDLRMSVQTYGDLKNLKETNRSRYSFNLNLDDLFASGVNTKVYFIYNYNPKLVSVGKSKLRDVVSIYEISIEYKVNDYHHFRFGRALNPYVFNIGSIDGIQYEYSFKKNTAGIFIGSRPDISNYWFNINLLQVGAFINRRDSIMKSELENSLAIVEQTNNFKPDRRFIYFQHRNNIIPLTNIFFTTELDYFQVYKGQIQKKLDFSSLYFSINFRPIKKLSVTASYDARRNVYYLESLKHSIDSLLENNFRKGLRFSTLFRIFNTVSLNFQYSERFSKGDPSKARNYLVATTFTNIPLIKSNLSVSASNFNAAVFVGKNYTINFSKNLLEDLFFTLNFRLYEYKNIKLSNLYIDRYLEVSSFVNIMQNLSLTFSFEKKLNREKSEWLSIGLTQRF